MKRYSREFKLEAVRLVIDEGQAIKPAAKNLGIDSNSLRNWIKKYQADPEYSFPGKGQQKPEDAEIHGLKKKLKQTEMERDILKKAITFFKEQDQ